MSSDPLSEILDLVNARCLLSGSLVGGGAWARRFERPDVIKFMAVAEGRCWVIMDGLAPVGLATGDVILVNGSRSFVLTSERTLTPEMATATLDGMAGMIVARDAGRDFLMIGGHVAADPKRQSILLDVLPPMIHVRSVSAEAVALNWVVDQIVREMAVDRPGAAVATAQLAQLMFVQALRAHLASAEPMEEGWLKALGDERIAPALRLMHGDPARSWTLGELAKAVAMSRTTFALRFKTAVGVAPLAYLLGWRMRLAERDLRDSEVPVSALARTLGYASESAFSNAFKRTIGMAPKRYRTSSRSAGSIALN
ncbi:MAG: transcriptional regulator, AraC family [Devosia sp.]|uniref:AraC family transcriptional regulator n=1 Tax=Devosia sp. TaxID=1871048 RepID=UPI002633FFBC|nr:AraC family transcriptional regulator [Devosia sp.]MDB5528911.1 transcriptional regulator, AraC family [Devosia sp.]